MAETAELRDSGKSRKIQQWLTLALVVCIVLCCTIPMGFLDLWNGEIPGHRNQYELMAEAILDGKLYIDYQETDELAQLENPYDPEERDAAKVSYHFDHAYYNGRNYMYFGVAPVFLLFIPYRVLTGHSLTTYHATQLFAALTIVGIFVLFDLLRKRFFPKMPYITHLALTSAVSVISIHYSIAEPALYCTAIIGGLAAMIWSFFFYIKAVWVETVENKQLKMAFFGALLGALAFGCRPTVAVSNLLVIPMLVVFLRQRKFSWALLGKLALAASPYIVIGVLLMLYNYVRFDNPFEFGQSYQLTMYDINQFAQEQSFKKFRFMFGSFRKLWFAPVSVSGKFPFFATGGLIKSYPVFLTLFGFFMPSFWKKLRKEKLALTVAAIALVIVIVTYLEISWSPKIMIRYHLDLYYLMGILAYLIVGLGYNGQAKKKQKVLSWFVVSSSVVSLLLSVFYYFFMISAYYGDKVDRIGQMLFG